MLPVHVRLCPSTKLNLRLNACHTGEHEAEVEEHEMPLPQIARQLLDTDSDFQQCAGMCTKWAEEEADARREALQSSLPLLPLTTLDSHLLR